MLGYIPSRERSLLKTFYEENYLYPMKEEIKWDTVKTVKKLAECVKSYSSDIMMQMKYLYNDKGSVYAAFYFLVLVNLIFGINLKYLLSKS